MTISHAALVENNVRDGNDTWFCRSCLNGCNLVITRTTCEPAQRHMRREMFCPTVGTQPRQGEIDLRRQTSESLGDDVWPDPQDGGMPVPAKYAEPVQHDTGRWHRRKRQRQTLYCIIDLLIRKLPEEPQRDVAGGNRNQSEPRNCRSEGRLVGSEPVREAAWQRDCDKRSHRRMPSRS